MTIYEIELSIKESLSNKRYNHTIAVSYIASALAMNYSMDVEEARIAGLLHDCAKSMENEELLSFCIKHKIDISLYEKENPALLHGKVGAYLAKKKYHIRSTEMLDAIKYHTTGRPNMTKLEQIIYISDYIEPNRQKLDRIDLIREIAFKDLDYAMFLITEDTLTYLNNTNKVLDIKTEETYHYYKEKYICLQKKNN